MTDSGSEKVLLKGSVTAFRNSFGEHVFHLACHAAVPVVLNSDLLHLLRINFFLEPPESLPYVAESQFLLSPLCNEVGSDLYEIPPDIRDSLLHELASNPAYGDARIREIAILLFEYSERFSPWKDSLMIERAQQLTALNFLDPESAKHWLESAEQQPQSRALNNREWFIAMRSEIGKLDAVIRSSREPAVSGIETSPDNVDVSPFGLKLLHSIKAHDKPIGRFAWSQDGSQLATPSADESVKIWDTRTGQLIRTLSGHTERVICVDWSPLGNTLASGSDDQTAKIWDTKSGRLIETMRYRPSSIASLAWSPDGSTLALGFNDSTVLLWQNGRVIEVLDGHGIVTSLKWSPDGTQLAAASEDETVVQLWNPKKQTISRRTLKHRAQVLGLDWSSNGKLIATGCSDNTVWLWRGFDYRIRKTLRGHTDIVNAVSFSSDGQILASKSHDGTVRFWRTDSGELVSVLLNQGSHFVVAGIAFNPHLPQLATLAQQDTVINIWQVDVAALLTRAIETAETSFATTKIILLGPSGVGKTSIAQAMRTRPSIASTSDYISSAESLKIQLPAGVRRETFVWDLGLPDPLLTRVDLHDADIVLLLFDTRSSNVSPDQMEAYWKAVTRKHKRGVRSIWLGVGESTDRGTEVMEELRQRFRNRNRDYWFVDVGDESQADELINRLRLEIAESRLSRQVSLRDIDVVESHIRELKEQTSTLYTGLNALRRSLSEGRKFTERQLRQCLWHLDRSGAVRLLRRSNNEEIVWLQPANVTRLLAIIIDEARSNQTDPGRAEEHPLTNRIEADHYLSELSPEAAATLLDCTANLLVDRELCFRIRGERRWLVFPELVPRREPPSETAYVAQDSPFDHLLAWLSPDREVAGERYEQIRAGLIKMFSSQGMPDAEGLADETFERITKKVDQVALMYEGDPTRYFYGVARNVYREYARKNLSLPIEPLSESQIYEPYDLDLESEQNCLDTCLQKLSSENRELILRYYTGQRQAKIDHRRELMEELRISTNTLRIRAHRIRTQLHKCIRDCLESRQNK